MNSKNILSITDVHYKKQKNDMVAFDRRRPALLCFSHLRWGFVYQRPQHLMSRFAIEYDILFIEEPVFTDEDKAILVMHEVKTNIHVLLPKIPKDFSEIEVGKLQAKLLEEFLTKNMYEVFILWYFTPMSITWTKNLSAKVTIYDCMDELTAFKNAPIELKANERELLSQADLVFTGGISLYHAKHPHHHAVYLFPSSVDLEHFSLARNKLADPDDQIRIPHPRIGFYGVIDERFDIGLIKQLAKCRPDWNFIIIGPVVKIDPYSLPQQHNIHYLEPKAYQELPYYLSGWDVALIPFAMNDSTKFISPTKTPEYLAGGKPVVSTPIADIIATYKNVDVVHIAGADNLPQFISAIESALSDSQTPEKVHEEADSILHDMSWDKTFEEMHRLILAILNKKVDANEYIKQQTL